MGVMGVIEKYPAMSKDDARAILTGLMHEGVRADRLSEKAKQEIRTAFETVLRLVEKENT